MTSISVVHLNEVVYQVTVSDERGQSIHQVTVRPLDVELYAAGSTPEELLEASFRFLLEREPKEAILARFELPVIERYFPEYRKVIAGLR